ncbi:MAG: type II secretion system F family protein [Candidatus Aenigmatarchaeota archaeon]
MLNFLAAFIGLGIPLLIKYRQLKITSEIESQFPNFLRDVTASIETGMTLPQAIRSVKTNDYGRLSRYVKDISAKLEWGIDFEKVLEDFASKVGSKTIRRSVRAINETHRSGGKIGTVLSAVSESQIILERVKKERSSSIYTQMINGYVIFFVFLGVMFALSRFLIPAFEWEEIGTETKEIYSAVFRNLVIIQGAFAGLAIGKMAEGSVFAGIKHSLVLVAIGYSVFTIL